MLFRLGMVIHERYVCPKRIPQRRCAFKKPIYVPCQGLAAGIETDSSDIVFGAIEPNGPRGQVMKSKIGEPPIGRIKLLQFTRHLSILVRMFINLDMDDSILKNPTQIGASLG